MQETCQDGRKPNFARPGKDPGRQAICTSYFSRWDASSSTVSGRPMPDRQPAARVDALFPPAALVNRNVTHTEPLPVPIAFPAADLPLWRRCVSETWA
jgi:hypothetical protein